jgi:ribonuclease VapC
VSVVLDASAVLALAFDEPGAEQVAASLGGAAICTVNESEVLAALIRSGATPGQARGAVAALGLASIPFDSAMAGAAADLFPATRRAGLSLGDRCCLALAAQLGRPALTADRGWRRVAGAVTTEISFIR